MSRPQSFVVAGLLALVAVAGGAVWWVNAEEPTRPIAEVAATTTIAETTTTAVPSPTAVAPLTGLPVDVADPRPALGVKIDQTPTVTRYRGLEQADVVYEVMVEGGITRGIALFQSKDADEVGPVRSVRTSDLDLVTNLDEPVLAFSGGDELTLRAVADAPVVAFSPDSPGGADAFFRDRSGRAPHNLFLSTPQVRAHAEGAGDVRPPFEIAAPDAPAIEGGLPVAGVRIRFSQSATIAYAWDAERSQWVRWAHGRPQLGTDDVQLGVDTVLVLDSEYGHAPWDTRAPELVSIGTGDGLLLTDGTALGVRWSRAGTHEPYALTRSDGTPLQLPAGRTWVSFPPAGGTAPLDDVAVAALGG